MAIVQRVPPQEDPISMVVARLAALARNPTGRNAPTIIEDMKILVPAALAVGWVPTPEQAKLEYVEPYIKLYETSKPKPWVRKTDLPAPKKVDTYLSLMADYYKFCSFLPIKYRPGMNKNHPEGGSGPLVLTSAQKKVLDMMINLLLYKKVPVRIILLKSRQLGCTTVMLAFWLWLMLKNKAYHVFFIIDKGAHATEKIDMLERWMEALRDAFPDEPDLPRIVKKHPHLLLSNQSILYYESAEASNPGTSEQLDVVHISEGPKYPRGRMGQLKASIQPALPIAPNTIMINEFTALGIDDCYLAFEKARDEGDPIPVFLAWYMSDEYRLPVNKETFRYSTAKEHGDGEDCPTEQLYALKYKLTDEQIAWRRMKISSDFNGQRVVFDQEYPTTIEHAWRNSAGGNHFGKAILDYYHKKAVDPVRYDIRNKSFAFLPTSPTNAATDCVPVLVQDQFGEFQIWKKRDLKRTYYMGGDVAEGKEPTLQSGDKEPDWTVFTIVDDIGNLCAAYATHIKPEEAWIPMLLLATLYDAIINCERNAAGNTLWSWFKLTGYNKLTVYPNPGKGWRPPDDRTWTYLSGPSLRNELLNNLRARISAQPSLPSETLYSEMTTFFKNPKTGKAEAASYAHDDWVMSLAHAYWAQAVEEGTIEVLPSNVIQADYEVMPMPKALIEEAGIDRPFLLQDTSFFDEFPGFTFGGDENAKSKAIYDYED